MNSSGSHLIDLHHWGKFEHVVLQVLEQFKLRLDKFALKTFSKIAWRWRHSKLKRHGLRVIKLHEDDLIRHLGCSRLRLQSVLAELKNKSLIDWGLDEQGHSIFWLAHKGEGILKELPFV